jgi:hypothetical protein
MGNYEDKPQSYCDSSIHGNHQMVGQAQVPIYKKLIVKQTSKLQSKHEQTYTYEDRIVSYFIFDCKRFLTAMCSKRANPLINIIPGREDGIFMDYFEITNLPSVKNHIDAIKNEQRTDETETKTKIKAKSKSKSKSISRVITVNIFSGIYKTLQDREEFITINPYFEYIESSHQSLSELIFPEPNKNVNANVLIYPPQTIEGGELVLGLSDCKHSETFKPFPDKWIIVVIPNRTSVLYESKIVTSGTKVVLKGVAFINYAD